MPGEPREPYKHVQVKGAATLTLDGAVETFEAPRAFAGKNGLVEELAFGEAGMFRSPVGFGLLEPQERLEKRSDHRIEELSTEHGVLGDEHCASLRLWESPHERIKVELHLRPLHVRIPERYHRVVDVRRVQSDEDVGKPIGSHHTDDLGAAGIPFVNGPLRLGANDLEVLHQISDLLGRRRTAK